MSVPRPLTRATALLGCGLLFTTLPACASDDAASGKTSAPAPKTEPRPGPKPKPKPKGTVTVDGAIGTYTSNKWSFETNSFWIEGPEGVVLVDTQFLLSAGRELVEAAEASTGKEVVLAVVLHPNPDKFNGTAQLQARGVRTITSAQVASFIPEVHQKRVGWFYDRYQPDYPREEPKPEVFGSASTSLDVAGITLDLRVLDGPGCSPAHVVVRYEDHVFVGDLVANGHHSWLEIGETAEWLERLDDIRALHPRRVHPGRGPSGGPELLDRETAYLERVIELVGAESLVMPPPKDRLAAVQQQLEDEHPGYGYSVFLKIGLPAEWRRQARARAVTPGTP